MDRGSHLLRRQDIQRKDKNQSREGQAAGVTDKGYGRLPAEGLRWPGPAWVEGVTKGDRQAGGSGESWVRGW